VAVWQGHLFAILGGHSGRGARPAEQGPQPPDGLLVADGTQLLALYRGELDIELPSVPDVARLVSSAHELCPYSRAIRGNVGVTLIVNGVRQ
jgi:hypothetical protein